MSTPTQEITLYFDLVSSFSYLAFSTLLSHPLFTQKNVKITYTPVSIGIILKKSGNTPPIIPGRKSAKQDYIVRDFARRARVLNVPILNGLPKGFPGGFDTRPILKILLVIQREFAEEVYAGAVHKFYHALWKDGVDFTSPDISQKLISSLELPGNPSTEDILAQAQSKEITTLLNKNTQEVLDQGGFGLPWIKATKPNGETDTWWGVDQLTQVAGFLDLDWPTEFKDVKIRHML